MVLELDERRRRRREYFLGISFHTYPTEPEPTARARRAGKEFYRRMPRKEVLRLRSLVLRGRARARRTRGADPVVARVLRLPNELVWKVLDYWRVTSDITGEVI